eukprot:TRINITY_DN15106_c0_g1_i1.p1 TRINITY_DN15106_c0_g1~~TRINITY_DN15106_c0_g1_i1.p1  ORF type:complete len:521 (+),score=149.67 TRINITY_DN15106_c0_g1_i1:67-1563(+)
MLPPGFPPVPFPWGAGAWGDQGEQPAPEGGGRPSGGRRRRGDPMAELDAAVGTLRGQSPSARQLARFRRLTNHARCAVPSASSSAAGLSEEQQRDLAVLQRRHHEHVSARREGQRARPAAAPATPGRAPRAARQEHPSQAGRSPAPVGARHVSYIANLHRRLGGGPPSESSSEDGGEEGGGAGAEEESEGAESDPGAAPYGQRLLTEAERSRLSVGPAPRGSPHAARGQQPRREQQPRRCGVARLSVAELLSAGDSDGEPHRTGPNQLSSGSGTQGSSAACAGAGLTQRRGSAAPAPAGMSAEGLLALDALHARLRQTYLDIQKDPAKFLASAAMSRGAGYRDLPPGPAHEALHEVMSRQDKGLHTVSFAPSAPSAAAARAATEMERLDREWDQLMSVQERGLRGDISSGFPVAAAPQLAALYAASKDAGTPPREEEPREQSAARAAAGAVEKRITSRIAHVKDRAGAGTGELSTVEILARIEARKSAQKARAISQGL